MKRESDLRGCDVAAQVARCSSGSGQFPPRHPNEEAHQMFLLRDEVSRHPGSPDFYSAEVACAFNDTATCEERFKKVIAAEPDSIAAKQVHHVLAYAAFREGRYGRAFRELDALLAIDPKDDDGKDTRPFYVNPHKNLFYCHGCGRGGDLIRFLELRLHLSFRSSVTYLREQLAPSAQLLEHTAAFYQLQLSRHPEAVHYLLQRGLRDPAVIEELGKGYAPGGKLRAHLSDLGYSLELLLQWPQHWDCLSSSIAAALERWIVRLGIGPPRLPRDSRLFRFFLGALPRCRCCRRRLSLGTFRCRRREISHYNPFLVVQWI
jgi:tetratricopeptide (TPR) repeat protein